MPQPRALQSHPSDASETSGGSLSRGRAKLQQLAAKRRDSSAPPLALQDEAQASKDKKLADAESNDSEGSDNNESQVEEVDSNAADTSGEDNEFKPKHDKKSEREPSKQEMTKVPPKVLKMVVLHCAICGKSSKVLAQG